MPKKQEKNYHKIAWIAEIAASQIVEEPKGNAFTVEKIVKKLLCFLPLSSLFKHFGITIKVEVIDSLGSLSCR